MVRTKSVQYEGEVVGAETFARQDMDITPLALLKIPETLLRLILHLEDRLGDAVENLSCIRQDAACPIMGAEDETVRGSRLRLARATLDQLELALDLLGIETPDRM